MIDAEDIVRSILDILRAQTLALEEMQRIKFTINDLNARITELEFREAARERQ